MQIREAVRISMSIPFFFQAVIIKSGDTLVDGGVIRNYPIDIFDDKKYLSESSLRSDGVAEAISQQKNNHIHNPETLGFRLADKNTVEGGSQKLNIAGIKSFALSLITFMQSTACNTHINDDDWRRTIAIDTTEVGVTEFDLSHEKIDMLVQNGNIGVEQYLTWRYQLKL